jgi:superfamily I DNA/RNA helicase
MSLHALHNDPDHVAEAPVGHSLVQPVSSLPASDQLLLSVEAQWWTQPSPKAEFVAEQLGLSLNAYEQRLRDLVNEQAALDYDPLLIRRLRRLAARPRRAAR